MIPIVVFWTKYSATMSGERIKIVPCENCSLEYVYIMERQDTGVGTSVYLLNPDAETNALSTAQDTLKTVLENDFDPVPCPACGHYQRYMFAKLREPKWMWIHTLQFLVIVLGAIALIVALGRSATYFSRSDAQAFRSMVVAWLILAPIVLTSALLSFVKHLKNSRFDPNLGDLEARLAIGRSRAVTREEFEKHKNAMGKNLI